MARQKKMDFRYIAIQETGETIATGDTLSSVQGFGNRIIVDNKKMRSTFQGRYPVAQPLWDVRPWPLQRQKISTHIHKKR